MTNSNSVVKVTKAQMFAEVIALANANGREDIATFAEHEIELLAKRYAKPSNPDSKKMKEQSEAKDKILTALVLIGKPVTVTTLIKEGGLEFSPQKVTSMLGKLVADGKVHKDVDKKTSLYSAIAE